MLTIRTCRQIANSRSIPSFRVCSSLSRGCESRLGELGRQAQNQGRIQVAESRRRWLCQQWQPRRLR